MIDNAGPRVSKPVNPSPPTSDAVLDPAWLEQVLPTAYREARIGRARVVEKLVTVATKIRFVVECERAPEGMPVALCLKALLDELDPLLGGYGLSVTEARFYQDCAPRLSLRVPACLYAGIDAERNQGTIILEDKVAQGATFLTALTPYRTDEVRETLDQLAVLHAETWQGRPLWDLDWPTDFLARIAGHPLVPLATLQEHLAGPRGDPLPAELRDAARLQTATGRLRDAFANAPKCLVHGDAHAGNIYRTSDGKVGLVDWQIVHRNCWAIDVAYHVAAVLTPDVRARHEAELLDHYRVRLHELGGPLIPTAEAWTMYRQAMLYGFYLWAVTRKVEPRITHEFTRRLGLACAELDSLALVGG